MSSSGGRFKVHVVPFGVYAPAIVLGSLEPGQTTAMAEAERSAELSVSIASYQSNKELPGRWEGFLSLSRRAFRFPAVVTGLSFFQSEAVGLTGLDSGYSVLPLLNQKLREAE